MKHESHFYAMLQKRATTATTQLTSFVCVKHINHIHFNDKQQKHESPF